MNKNLKITKECVILKIDSQIYPKETIFAAGYVFLHKCYILIDKEKNKFVVSLYPQGKKANLKKLGMDFHNELLNYGHYFSQAKLNAQAIKAIMQRALFSAAPALAEESQDQEIKKLIQELEAEGKNEQKSDRKKRKK